MPPDDPQLKLETLLKQPNNATIWRGSESKLTQAKPFHTLDTGYCELNQQLHTGGWPLTTTNEIGLNQNGIGELRLLIPALKTLQTRSQKQNILWIAPPYLPYAPGLVKEGIDVSKLTIVDSKNIKDIVWAAEQALLSESCAAVLCWTQAHMLSNAILRRLQLAAKKTNTWSILLRHSSCLEQASVSGLRIKLACTAHSQLAVHIVKQTNGWGGQRCTLSPSPHYENWQRLAVDLWPNRQLHNSTNEKPTKQKPKPATVTVLMPLSRVGTVH